MAHKAIVVVDEDTVSFDVSDPQNRSIISSFCSGPERVACTRFEHEGHQYEYMVIKLS